MVWRVLRILARAIGERCGIDVLLSDWFLHVNIAHAMHLHLLPSTNMHLSKSYLSTTPTVQPQH